MCGGWVVQCVVGEWPSAVDGWCSVCLVDGTVWWMGDAVCGGRVAQWWAVCAVCLWGAM